MHIPPPGDVWADGVSAVAGWGRAGCRPGCIGADAHDGAGGEREAPGVALSARGCGKAVSLEGR